MIQRAAYGPINSCWARARQRAHAHLLLPAMQSPGAFAAVSCCGQRCGQPRGRRTQCGLVAAELFGLALPAVYAFDWVWHNPYCAVLFRCGCTFPWAGGWAKCNVHHADGPKCPWCNVMNTSLRSAAVLITNQFTIFIAVLAYAAAFEYQRRSGRLVPTATSADENEGLMEGRPQPSAADDRPILIASQPQPLPQSSSGDGQPEEKAHRRGGQCCGDSWLRLAGVRAAAALGAWLLWGLTMGLVWKLETGYPCFLWVVDEETHCGGMV